MTVENISWSISTKECCRPRRGLNPRPPGLQSDGASNWATEADAFWLKQTSYLKLCWGTWVLFQTQRWIGWREGVSRVNVHFFQNMYMWHINQGGSSQNCANLQWCDINCTILLEFFWYGNSSEYLWLWKSPTHPLNQRKVRNFNELVLGQRIYSSRWGVSNFFSSYFSIKTYTCI